MKRIASLTLMILAVFVVRAQEEADTFTDEELTKYATVMKWADGRKKEMGKEVGVWVKESEALSGAKYKELSSANKKGELESAEATEEEMTAFQDILQRTEDSKANFKETYTTKIKEDIGAGLYNRLRKALKADAELKTRYDEVYAAIELTEETPEESGDTDTSSEG